jgi:hypothetical protein
VQVALKVTVPLLPAIEFVVVAMLPVPLALWHEPPADAEQVHEQPDSDAGNASLIDTLLTATSAVSFRRNRVGHVRSGDDRRHASRCS